MADCKHPSSSGSKGDLSKHEVAESLSVMVETYIEESRRNIKIPEPGTDIFCFRLPPDVICVSFLLITELMDFFQEDPLVLVDMAIYLKRISHSSSKLQLNSFTDTRLLCGTARLAGKQRGSLGSRKKLFDQKFSYGGNLVHIENTMVHELRSQVIIGETERAQMLRDLEKLLSS